ncbi:hypothetical protein P6144_07675 [Sphingomonas sp. HITSZ_GF]|uniref:hypothetical protein n=1 Tax=Sphingomonas sp. HITSZ_GF TaxID=3037247 RepID=UPI00240D0E30|nr:hypothetical protein [Sphingomonas sp. HITSZ_GF]MDG2533519.1 hypothetical protein [Sphingomonas sp. HITSZ_GF]
MQQTSVQPAPAITLGGFLDRWARVESLKEMARVDPDTRILAEAFARSIVDWKAGLDADAAAGRPPRACPVKGSSVNFRTEEIVPVLRAMPAEARARPFRDAMADYLNKRFPCA